MMAEIIKIIWKAYLQNKNQRLIIFVIFLPTAILCLFTVGYLLLAAEYYVKTPVIRSFFAFILLIFYGVVVLLFDKLDKNYIVQSDLLENALLQFEPPEIKEILIAIKVKNIFDFQGFYRTFSYIGAVIILILALSIILRLLISL